MLGGKARSARGLLLRMMRSLRTSLVRAYFTRDVALAASVVIITRERSSCLDLTLRALERQHFPRDAWEVLVVDEASRDCTKEVVDSTVSRGLLNIKYHGVDNKNRAASRNVALSEANGSIICFLGDDRLVPPHFIETHLANHMPNGSVVLGNDVYGILTHVFSWSEPLARGAALRPAWSPELVETPEHWGDYVFQRKPDLASLFDLCRARNAMPPLPWTYFDAENASVPRQALLRVGGFDESYADQTADSYRLGEKELAYRLMSRGMSLRMDPQAYTFQQLMPYEILDAVGTAVNDHRIRVEHPELWNEDILEIIRAQSQLM